MRNVEKLSFILVTPFLLAPRLFKSGTSATASSLVPSLRFHFVPLPYRFVSPKNLKLRSTPFHFVPSQSANAMSGQFIVPSKVFYSFTLIPFLSTPTMLIIKVVHCGPMIVANFLDRYLPGILAVSMNRLFYLVPFGRITGAYSSYSSSQRPDLPSLPTPPLEPFPSFSQSLTLSNRLSINMPAGSSPSTSLSVPIGFFINDNIILGYLVSWFPLLVFTLEVLNFIIQSGILNILYLEYND